MPLSASARESGGSGVGHNPRRCLGRAPRRCWRVLCARAGVRGWPRCSLRRWRSARDHRAPQGGSHPVNRALPAPLPPALPPRMRALQCGTPHVRCRVGERSSGVSSLALVARSSQASLPQPMADMMIYGDYSTPGAVGASIPRMSAGSGLRGQRLRCLWHGSRPSARAIRCMHACAGQPNRSRRDRSAGMRGSAWKAAVGA